MKKPLFISIRTKFILLVVSLIVLTMIFNTYYVIKHDKKMIREEMESKARSIAASLSLEGTEAMIENLYLIQESLTNFSRLPGVSQIVFIDNSDMITAANDTSKIGEILSGDPLFQAALQQKKETLEYYKNKDGFETLVIFEPMLLNRKLNGWIRLDLSLKEREEKTRNNFYQLIKLAFVFTVIAVFSTFVISQKIRTVLKILVSKFKKLAEGDFTEKLLIHAHDELGEVASSYNILIDQMRQMVQQLEGKQKRVEEELKDSEEFFRALYENAKHPVYVFDDAFHFVDVNPYACEFYGYSREEFKRMNLLSLAPPDEQKSQRQSFEKMRREGGIFIRELKQQKRNGDTIIITADNVGVHRGGRHFYVSKVTDITERKLAEDRLSHLANYDGLTSLPNRVLFADRLDQALAQARRNQTLVALLFLDLDRFKLINDTQGHHIGDQLLKAIAKTLTAGRETDTVTRLGGDEFTVILTNITHAKDAALVAEKILNAISLVPFRVANQEIFVTASVGITLFPYDGEDIETLLKNADTAMYRAKEKGRNNFQFYTSDMNQSALERLELETNLRWALERGEFLLYYQPVVDLDTGKITGAEALLRWQHPTRGLMLPENFIFLAEENGLIIPLGDWVITTACRQNQAWQEAGLTPIRMAVNISVNQFKDQKFIETVRWVLKEARLNPNYLEIELAESNLMQNLEKTRSAMNQLNRLGINISIDDFGMSCSPLIYLRTFPIDTLKINQTFVQGIPSNSDDEAITSAIIAMAHSLKLKVIAEGVETKEQLTYLRSQKCDRMQGRLFCPPLEPSEFGKLLASKKYMNLNPQ